ncbi:uncharacterized protein KY384_006237 [Bacidia gigantensis]|uniref:uncharacterized protein n=1 Tax=Bacidia gigantensis TaxID=2732470 RepID=UPI001D05807F|nr:uncharacterized protein KY384_006237 [Bacidia gigantensis]KAG8529600.1 hypothetical protein KY384_006237 [Bacidia gigantensis]
MDERLFARDIIKLYPPQSFPSAVSSGMYFVTFVNKALVLFVEQYFHHALYGMYIIYLLFGNANFQAIVFRDSACAREGLFKISEVIEGVDLIEDIQLRRVVDTSHGWKSMR